jgi:F-type H+-transporting ATPase subunit delta
MGGGDLRAARRYARALFQTALKSENLDLVAENLDAISSAARTTPEFMNVLRHPRITRDRKKTMLHHIFEGRVQPLVEHFLFLIIEKDRAGIIPNIAAQFHELLDEHRREIDAEAISAVPMTEAQTEALRTRLKAATGYNIRLVTRVDDSILGGLMVRVGDKLYDGSLAAQLQRIEEQLRQVKVS